MCAQNGRLTGLVVYQQISHAVIDDVRSLHTISAINVRQQNVIRHSTQLPGWPGQLRGSGMPDKGLQFLGPRP